MSTERPLEERLRVLSEAKVRLDKLHGDQITRQVEREERWERGEMEDYDFPALRTKPQQPEPEPAPEPEPVTTPSSSTRQWEDWVNTRIRNALVGAAEATADAVKANFVKKDAHDQAVAALTARIDALAQEVAELRNANAKKSNGWFR